MVDVAAVAASSRPSTVVKTRPPRLTVISQYVARLDEQRSASLVEPEPLAVDGDDLVALLEAERCGNAAFLELRDDHAVIREPRSAVRRQRPATCSRGSRRRTASGRGPCTGSRGRRLRRRHELDLDRGSACPPRRTVSGTWPCDALQGEAVAEGIRVIDGLAVHRENGVASLQAGFGGRSLFVDRRRPGRRSGAPGRGRSRYRRPRAEGARRARAARTFRRRRGRNSSTTRTMLEGTAKPMPMLPPERE